jgi:hypothetical protein
LVVGVGFYRYSAVSADDLLHPEVMKHLAVFDLAGLGTIVRRKVFTDFLHQVAQFRPQLRSLGRSYLEARDRARYRVDVDADHIRP